MTEPGSDPDPTLLDGLESSLGYRFIDKSLLETAICHASYANEAEDVASNETMEFLGDAVIGLAVSHMLYVAKPDWREGDLSRAAHGLIEGRSLAAAARSVGLGEHLRLGRTERSSGGREKDSILEDAMEAIFGAIYLDAGLDPVVEFARRLFGEALTADAPKVERHPKMRFNERVMKYSGSIPRYVLIEDSGVESDDGRFIMSVEVDGREIARGRGRTKRAAEREAAELADDALSTEMAESPGDSQPAEDGPKADRV